MHDSDKRHSQVHRADRIQRRIHITDSFLQNVPPIQRILPKGVQTQNQLLDHQISETVSGCIERLYWLGVIPKVLRKERYLIRLKVLAHLVRFIQFFILHLKHYPSFCFDED